MLPGSKSLNSPKPVLTKVFGLICQAMAVLGCRMANGVGSNRFPIPVRISAFSGRLTSCDTAAEEPGSRATRSCGFSGFELCVVLTPNLEVKFAHHFPRILHIKISIKEIERLRAGQRISCRCGGCDAIDELGQIRISDRGRNRSRSVEPFACSCRSGIRARLRSRQDCR